jgi:ATP-dependent Zn protease
MARPRPTLEVPAVADWLARHRIPVAPATRAEIFGLDEVIDVVDGVVDRLARGTVGGDRGFLFSGPPGTGKTLTARYMATRISTATGREIPFYVLPLDELTPALVREIFTYIDCQPEPSIVYIDEIDGFARQPQDGSGHPADRALRLAFLSAIDGVADAPRRTLLIGATNIDPIQIVQALLRAGRMGRTLIYRLPSEEAAAGILGSLLGPHSDLEAGEIALFARIGRNALSGADYRFIAEDAIARAEARGRRVIAEDVATALRARGHNAANRDDENEQDPRSSGAFLLHEIGHAVALSALAGPEEVRSIALFDRYGAHVSGKDRTREEDALLFGPVARAGRIAEEMIEGTANFGAHADMERYNTVWLRLIANGRWPQISLPFDVNSENAAMPRYLPEIFADQPLRNELAALRRAFDAWSDTNARAALEANRHLLLPLREAIVGRVGIDNAAWLALLEEHGPIVRVAPTPLPELLLPYDSRRA